jgi:hydrogenase/urease accessory protein HupE
MGNTRGALHPVAAFVTVAILGSTLGIGLHVWCDPRTSCVAVSVGAVAGLFVSHALGDSLTYGLLVGGFLALLALGVRAFASVVRTLSRPPGVTSPRVWFTR